MSIFHSLVLPVIIGGANGISIGHGLGARKWGVFLAGFVSQAAYITYVLTGG